MLGYDLDAHMWRKFITIGRKGVWDLGAYFKCWGLSLRAYATSMDSFLSFPLFRGFVAAIAPEGRILETKSATRGHHIPQT